MALVPKAPAHGGGARHYPSGYTALLTPHPPSHPGRHTRQRELAAAAAALAAAALAAAALAAAALAAAALAALAATLAALAALSSLAALAPAFAAARPLCGQAVHRKQRGGPL